MIDRQRKEIEREIRRGPWNGHGSVGEGRGRGGGGGSVIGMC